jgi:hypothetical protein
MKKRLCPWIIHVILPYFQNLPQEPGYLVPHDFRNQVELSPQIRCQLNLSLQEPLLLANQLEINLQSLSL